MPRIARLSAALGAAATAVLLTAAPAAAHVTIDIREAQAGGYTFATFRVPHGCEGSPTTAMKVKIPEGVVSVKPEAVAGWTVATTKGPITPYESDGTTISEGVTEVSWTGGPLDDAHVAQFGMSLKMPDEAGETLYFPVVQTCEEGETAWIEIPEGEAEEELEHPAPGIKLISAEEEDDQTVATTEDEEASGESAASSDDDDTDPLSIVALVVGSAGLLVGLLSLRRRPPAA